MEDLFALYGRLADISGAGDFYVARVLEGRSSYRIGKDPDGNPALLVAAEPASESMAVPVKFRNLSFQPRCICRVRQEGATDFIENLSVLKCITDEPMLREYFLRSLSGTVAGLPPIPTETNISDVVAKLVELFRVLEAPPRKSLQGLWCELLLIARARQIRQAATAWHGDPGALHDFAAGRQRLEVKSSMGPHRVHHFNLEQLLLPQEADWIIASFMLEESGKGVSIVELWDEISQSGELSVDLRNRLSQILALGLGRDWRKAQRVAFDPDAAWNDLRLYDASVVPKVDPGLPVEVSEVRFRSELTDVPSLSLAVATRRGGLFEAIFG